MLKKRHWPDFADSGGRCRGGADQSAIPFAYRGFRASGAIGFPAL